MSQLYHKIETVFQRDLKGSKKLLPGVFVNELVEYLQDNMWIFTEKVDGTNIRVMWDGFHVSFGGRTEAGIEGEIPKPLLMKLKELFSGDKNEQLFEQMFGEKEVILFGEGYGEKINKGGDLYCDGVSFILFDIRIGGVFVERKNLISIANAFHINFVPIILRGTINDGIYYVKQKPQSKVAIHNREIEGIVGVPEKRIYDVNGNRVIVKIKVRDFCKK